MESGYACFCGNDVDRQHHEEAPSTECNHVCFGDHTQPCGGDGRVIIFDSEYSLCACVNLSVDTRVCVFACVFGHVHLYVCACYSPVAVNICAVCLRLTLLFRQTALDAVASFTVPTVLVYVWDTVTQR